MRIGGLFLAAFLCAVPAATRAEPNPAPASFTVRSMGFGLALLIPPGECGMYCELKVGIDLNMAVGKRVSPSFALVFDGWLSMSGVENGQIFLGMAARLHPLAGAWVDLGLGMGAAIHSNSDGGLAGGVGPGLGLAGSFRLNDSSALYLRMGVIRGVDDQLSTTMGAGLDLGRW